MKNCTICGNSIGFDHHFGRCWKCVCKERLNYYEEGLKIYEKHDNKHMIDKTKKEIEQWKTEIDTYSIIE